MSHLLEVQGLTTAFAGDYGKTVSVDHIHFHVDEKEVVCIVGESGCGKSVTSLSIMGLLGKGGAVTDGSVLFDGKNLLVLAEKELDQIRGNEITMIFQDPLTSLNPVFTVGNQITESIRTHMHLPKKEARERAVDLLRRVGMPDAAGVMKKYPHTLSGGMRQRVMIAMALSCNPKLLIADEPTTALDVTIQAQILELMQELQKKMGMAIIMVTHDLGVIASMCDEIIVMYGGRVCERGTAEDIFYRSGHEYTKGLLRSIPKADGSKERLVPIAGTPINLLNLPKGCAFCARCDEAMKICLTDVPPQVQMPDGHYASCWLTYKKQMEETGGAANE